MVLDNISARVFENQPSSSRHFCFPQKPKPIQQRLTWHLCRTSFGRHLPPTTDINKVQLSSPADHKCNSSSDHPAKVLRLSNKMTSDTWWCHKAPHVPHETTLLDVWNVQKCASFSTFKHGTCKAFPAPCTCVPVWTFRSHPYCDARATETSFPCGSSVLATYHHVASSTSA